MECGAYTLFWLTASFAIDYLLLCTCMMVLNERTNKSQTAKASSTFLYTIVFMSMLQQTAVA